MQSVASHRPETPARVPGTALSPQQLARIETRRAFVEMKQTFMSAVATLDDDDDKVRRLKAQLRRALAPDDLWLLRGPVFAALRRDTLNGPRLRQELRRSLATVFPDTFGYSGFVSF